MLISRIFGLYTLIERGTEKKVEMKRRGRGSVGGGVGLCIIVSYISGMEGRGRRGYNTFCV